MHTFEKSTKIDCSVEKLFEFHLDANNLKKITPKDIKVKMLSSDFHAQKGEILKLKTIKYGIPTIWEVRIEDIQKPHKLVDKALRSPFSFWEHQHLFSETEDGSVLKDIVHFKMPLGFIGKLFVPLVQKDLESMFTFRHQVTKEALENS